MHNGEPQFDKGTFSVPVGSSRTTQEEWERIFGKKESNANTSNAVQQDGRSTHRKF